MFRALKQMSLPLALGALLVTTFTSASGQVLSFRATGSDFGCFGCSVATIADIDHDGVQDILVGEPAYASLTDPLLGRVSIYSGKTGALLRQHTGEVGDQVGWAVADADDVDGDGVGDYLIGAPGSNGKAGGVLMKSGATGATLWSFSSKARNWFQGKAVSRIGDVNGDGVEDVAVGSPDVGHLDLVNGRTGQFFSGFYDPDGNQFGFSIAVCDDLDDDDVRDFLVGWPKRDDATHGDNGGVVLISSRTSNTIAFWVGDGNLDNLGTSVASIGDVNGDGIGDLLMGAAGATKAGVWTGLVRLVSGKDFTVLRNTYGAADEKLGFSVAGLGDVNRDGVPDYVAGVPFSKLGTVGVAILISGADGHSMHRFVGEPQRNPALGYALAGGDFNQDGIGDLVITDTNASIPGGGPTGSMDVYLGCPSITQGYGTGWPGKLGFPTLTSTAPALGTTVLLTVSNSLGAPTIGVLLLGFAPTNILMRSGATLLVSPSFSIMLSLPTPGLTFGGTIPSDPALGFLDLYQQVIELDSFAVGGQSFTAGLHQRLGFDL